VVANRAGGIPLQMEDGIGGFLVDTTEQCAEKSLYLLEHPKEAKEIGARGKERVRERFLTPRLVADWLRLLTEI
jgi:trehalose synthase